MKYFRLQFDPKRALLFTLYASAAAATCQWSGTLPYLAPFIASAALLANAGEQLKKSLVATAVVYGISILIAGLAIYLLAINLFNAVLWCALCYIICLCLSQQHPPAMALLLVLIMRPPTVADSLGLLLTVFGFLIVGMLVPIAKMMARRANSV